MAIKKITIDPNNPPALTAEDKKMLAELAKMPDSTIDLSDIPEVKDTNGWVKHNPFLNEKNYRPKKELITFRLDKDIVDWLRSTGKGYQTRTNNILRQAMLEKIGE